MAKSAAVEKLEGEIEKVKELLKDANDDTKELYETSLERKKEKLKNLLAGEAEGNKGEVHTATKSEESAEIKDILEQIDTIEPFVDDNSISEGDRKQAKVLLADLKGRLAELRKSKEEPKVEKVEKKVEAEVKKVERKVNREIPKAVAKEEKKEIAEAKKEEAIAAKEEKKEEKKVAEEEKKAEKEAEEKIKKEKKEAVKVKAEKAPGKKRGPKPKPESEKKPKKVPTGAKRGPKPKNKEKKVEPKGEEWTIVVEGHEYNIDRNCKEAVDALLARKKQVTTSAERYKTASPSVKAANSLERTIGHIGKSLDKEMIEDNPKKVIAALREFKNKLNQAFTALNQVVEDKVDIKRLRDALDVIAEIIEKIKD